MKFKIAVLAGDGIGPEITKEAVRVLEQVAKLDGFEIETEDALIGGCAIDQCGEPLPAETVEICKQADAILLGAVGGPKWDNVPPTKRPEAGLLAIRSELGLFANLRPALVYSALRGASPLKDEILGDGLDILVVRELTGGIYFGERGTTEKDGQIVAHDTESYSDMEISRIAKVAYDLAGKRGGKLCSVDKANVLDSSRLWRKIVSEMASEYPEIQLSHMYVDNAAMQLVRAPRQFDTIVTGNMFGDILSDEASQITGSIGMLPSASLGEGKNGLYEPIHGSAPDIAGTDKANPLATILSVAMMLRYSLDLPGSADRIEAAVNKVLESGLRTADIAEAGDKAIGTKEMGDAVVASL